MGRIARSCVVVIALGCGSQGPGGTRSGYWGGSRPDPNVQLPSLPAAASVQASSPEESARELAKRVLAGGDGALPALVAALQASGIAVADPDRTVLVTPQSPAQGWGMERWEALVLGLHPESQTLVALPDLFAALAPDIPITAPGESAARLLADIRAQATSDKPTQRFFALFLVELGRQGPQAQDLLGSVLPPDVMLGGLQAGLILRRLVADLHVFTRKAGAATSARALSQASGPARSAGSASSAPCRMTESESLILDGSALGITWTFDKLMEYFVHEGGLSAPFTISKATGAANILLAYAKLFLYFANLKVDLRLEGDPPLVRTKNTRAGESRKLTADASFDLGNGQIVNCLRIMLNMAGMDLSVPNSGKLAGSPTEWIGLDGFSADSNRRIVQFHGDPEHGRTDEEGRAEIAIEGAPQKFVLPETSAPIMKKARARFLVAPKPPGFSQDLMDAATAAAGGPLSIFGLAPVETLLRTRLLKPFDYWVEVKDWTGPWKGKITFKQSGGRSETVIKGPGSSVTTTASIDRTVELTISGVLLELPPFPGHDETFVELKTATVPTVSQSYQSHVHEPSVCDQEGGCNPMPPPYDTLYVENLAGAQTSDSYQVLHLKSDGSYEIELQFDPGSMAGTWSDSWSGKSGPAQVPGGPISMTIAMTTPDPYVSVIQGSKQDAVVKTITCTGQAPAQSRSIDIDTTISVEWRLERGVQ